MRPISAVDAVSPAIERTREFLFRPFKWGTYLKLGLVAIITEGLGSNFHSSTPRGDHGGGSGVGHVPSVPWPLPLTPTCIAEIVAAALLAIVLSVFVFYLITRLRFAFFHCLVHNTKEIKPGWQLYRGQASRFFWLNIVVGICFMALLVLVALPFAAGFWRLFQESQLGGHFNVGLLLALVLPLIPIVILLVVAGILTDLILRDWMMPHMALEDATAGEAWRQVRTRMMAEKRQFLVYGLLRVILPTIATIGVFIVLALPGLMLAGSLAAIEYGVHTVFADATGASWLVGIVLEVFFGVVAFGFALLASICVGGPLSTGLREYALIFYGGRYKALGDILYPPPAIVGGTTGAA
ncbi:MAG: hypothetical protein ABSE53_01855 [Terracidiphilus sp.]|jgi:hypothetical protein